MRAKGLICGVGLACLLCVLFLPGCISRDAVFQDIYENRRVAYEAWKRAKEGKTL